MYDIIIENGKKYSFIKIIDNRLEGFNILDGMLSHLTEEELKIVNSIKLSENKTYLGKYENFDVYKDNNSGLKHFFKNQVEDIEKFCEYNTTDALSYNELSSRIKQTLKKENNYLDGAFKTKLGKNLYCIIGGTSIAIILSFTAQKTYTSYKINTAKPITYETICNYIEEDENLKSDEKELINNKKLLNDIIPYYNGTNMDYVATTCFDDLHFNYFEKRNKNGKEITGYYTRLFPNRINLKEGHSIEERNKNICHEYIHLLQNNRYSYLKEACAEIIASEYYSYSIEAYDSAVKNTKILIEIVGPEVIWKLNFAGNDNELVSLIEKNLESEKAKQLIDLLKTEPDAKEGMDKDIRTLLEELYYNMYLTDMKENIYITHIMDDTLIDRYYFNSDRILENNPCYLKGKDIYNIKKELNYEEYLKVLNKNDGIKVKKVWVDESLNGTMPLEKAYELGKLKFYYEDQIWGKTEEEINTLLSSGYSVEYLGDIYVSKETQEMFKENKNNNEYIESTSNFYEIMFLPNIYETFPNDKIEKDNTLN